MVSQRPRTLFIACGLLASSAVFAQRAPTVTYSVSGSSGNFTLNFNVTNNFLSNEGWIYFFGVYFDTGRNIVGSPDASWNPNTWASWNNSPYGGSNTNYNNNWLGNSGGGDGSIAAGASLNGFQALYTGANAPSSVQWFAFGFGGTYGGNDNFNSAGNPGFEGRALSAPEPMSLVALGLGAVAIMRRRKR